MDTNITSPMYAVNTTLLSAKLLMAAKRSGCIEGKEIKYVWQNHDASAIYVKVYGISPDLFLPRIIIITSELFYVTNDPPYQTQDAGHLVDYEDVVKEALMHERDLRTCGAVEVIHNDLVLRIMARLAMAKTRPDMKLESEQVNTLRGLIDFGKFTALKIWRNAP